ncbi:MAG: BlaI/MecI/CopY family transcriptional regulator [Pirellulaceae bacterium]
MAKRKCNPSELELLILKVLWDAQGAGETPLAVRDVRSRLNEIGRDLAHTSVITMLNIMTTKKMLRRSKRKNAMFYTPIISEADVQRDELDDVLLRVFDGSPARLMLTLLDRSDVNAQSIAEIRKLIEQAQREQRAGGGE